MPKRSLTEMETAVGFALKLGQAVPQAHPYQVHKIMLFARQLQQAYNRDATEGLNYEQARRVKKKRDELELYVSRSLGTTVRHTPSATGSPFKIAIPNEQWLPVQAI